MSDLDRGGVMNAAGWTLCGLVVTSAAVATPAIADDQTAVSKAQAGASAERRERRPPARVQEQREARDRVRLTFPPPRR
jgi:hypothetical protein